MGVDAGSYLDDRASVHHRAVVRLLYMQLDINWRLQETKVPLIAYIFPAIVWVHGMGLVT